MQLLADAKAELEAQDKVCRARRRQAELAFANRTGPARAQAGWTPLHWAACKGRGPVAIELIRRGASADARSMVRVRPSSLPSRRLHGCRPRPRSVGEADTGRRRRGDGKADDCREDSQCRGERPGLVHSDFSSSHCFAQEARRDLIVHALEVRHARLMGAFAKTLKLFVRSCRCCRRGSRWSPFRSSWLTSTAGPDCRAMAVAPRRARRKGRAQRRPCLQIDGYAALAAAQPA